ncbi:unnamed protein product, partial [Trichogramma brassicae]
QTDEHRDRAAERPWPRPRSSSRPRSSASRRSSRSRSPSSSSPSDVANKTNIIDLQKTIKKQSLTLTELQSHYDEVQRQLKVTLDQLGISQPVCSRSPSEIEEVRGKLRIREYRHPLIFAD